MDDYMLRFLAKQRYAEMQAFLYKQALARSLKPPRRSVRRLLGIGLIRIGRWLLRQVPPRPAAPPPLPRVRQGA